MSFKCDKEATDHASNIRVPNTVSEILATTKELSLTKESIPSKKSCHSSIEPTVHGHEDHTTIRGK